MNFLFYILIAIVSGIFAGMGMGGGTFLIPLLTLFMFVPQNVAQDKSAKPQHLAHKRICDCDGY